MDVNKTREINQCPLKRDHFKRRGSSSNHQFFRGYVCFQRGTSAHYTFHNKFSDIQKHPLIFMPQKKSNNIVDGHNPAPVALVNILRITMFDPGRLDVFLHQRLSSHMAPFIPLRRIHFAIFPASWWPNDQRLRQSPAG